MSRTELQALAVDRIEDARLLLANGRWQAAYYLAGYAVECGLKSCILMHIEKTGVIFKEKKFAEKCWTHNLVELVNQAGLKPTLDQNLGTNTAFAGFWGVAKDWTETSRYEAKTETNARELFEAIDSDPDGVFKWLQNYW